MRFSVIVPVYNVEHYLRRCLDSIVNQTFDDYEVVLVDDGSTDASGSICDEYRKKYNSIKVIHQENKGQSGARNTGLDKALGDWIVFVDSDDWIEKEMLQELDRQICKYPSDLYSFNVRKIFDGTISTENIIYTAEHSNIFFFSEEGKFDFYFNSFMQYKVGWEVCFHIYRRDLIEYHGLQFGSTQAIFAEDYLFTFQYLLRAKSMRMLCNIFYNYFQRKTSTLRSLKKQTVLPRLMEWGKYAYKDICRLKLHYFKKNYEKIYFMLLNYHLQNLLLDQSENVLLQIIQDDKNSIFHKRMLKKMEKEKEEFEKYMVNIRWL